MVTAVSTRTTGVFVTNLLPPLENRYTWACLMNPLYDAHVLQSDHTCLHCHQLVPDLAEDLPCIARKKDHL